MERGKLHRPARITVRALVRIIAPVILAAFTAALISDLSAQGQSPVEKTPPKQKKAAGLKKPVEKHGGNIVFQNSKPTREAKDHVLFSHSLHLARGSTCNDCHNGKVFAAEKKLGANKFTMKDISIGKACGACHDGVSKMKDGKAVFGPSRNCSRCHDVKVRPVD